LKEGRARVSVSEAMLNYRRIHDTFNKFWMSTELSYCFVASSKDFDDPDAPALDVLGHLDSWVWHENNQRRMRWEQTVKQFLAQIHANETHVYRATLLSMFSAFEAYLDQRVGPLRPKVRSWGPFLEKLSPVPAFRKGEGPCPLDPSVILRADICRQIRNKITHEGLKAPMSLEDSAVVAWKGSLLESLDSGGIPWERADVTEAMHAAANDVVGQARNMVGFAHTKGIEVPFEYFYMLDTFANLDSLALRVEQALQPPDAVPDFWVTANERKVLRKDLIVPAPGPANHRL
jgi:hypothetical protein